ncbi:MAG: hypothetical protein BMS9Abin05_1194 [Rhodothermia bacterium]|nr:MAG: hypothetical protein BMS9Abin05_1194 [Rhodothermia bacterium]
MRSELVRGRWLAWLIATVAMLPVRPSVAQELLPQEILLRESLPLNTSCGLLDLYCISLFSTPRALQATGRAVLARPRTPFGVAVSRDGRQRYLIDLTIEGLPPPEDLGPYTTYVVWATTPELKPIYNLGTAGNGQFELREVSLNKFLIFVSAEAEPGGSDREGPLVLRGQSASSRMKAHGAFQIASIGIAVGSIGSEMEREDAAHGLDHKMQRWMSPPMHALVPVMPGMERLRPFGEPWMLDGIEGVNAVPSKPRQVYQMADGDSLVLRAGPVLKSVGGKSFLMYGYNDQIPGPVIEVSQAATIVVDFINDTAQPSSIHWHGLRHDNQFDGVPGVTQEPVAPGETFRYLVHFPDAGIYWYHPHYREDIQQDLGLAGNILVRSADPEYFSAVDHEEILVLDDFLVSDSTAVPFGGTSANYMLMGRFGNTLLVNGETRYQLTVEVGDVARFYITNVSNTRTFNLSLDGHMMKVVASDMGRFEQEVLAESAAIAPAERYIVDFRFEQEGSYTLVNRIQSINHQLGVFFSEIDTLGTIRVGPNTSEGESLASVPDLRERSDVKQEIDPFRGYFDREPDRELELTLETDDLPPVITQFMRLGRIYFSPVEWSGTMPMMNWATTGKDIKWIIRDARSGDENTNIDWRVPRGTVEKIRIHNRQDAAHAMQHPIHLHGQRFLVVKYNGRLVENLAWKDTVLIPAGMTAELVVDYTNPGRWMMHCHIAEHLESGMKLVFEVTD